MSTQKVADALADAAVAPITSGMIVGLGTGSTARRGIRALAERVREEGLKIKCVPTSDSSEAFGREQGLPMLEFALVEELDYLFDGADEVDPQLRIMKGSGGAMTRERIVAWAAKKVVYMIAAEKLVEHLGSRTTLAIAVIPFGLASIRAHLRDLGLNGVCRRDLKGQLFLTDNGNLIVDVALGPEHDAEEIAEALNAHPGVVDHGLFLYEADEVLVDRGSGNVERLVRKRDE
ncbi:MAG: ribose-5-phosphate isomerase RpiA [Phycisphaerales bacterium]|nr:ribose-5-phosphate isomerase RpiA [Phycisphaerales bacterium]